MCPSYASLWCQSMVLLLLLGDLKVLLLLFLQCHPKVLYFKSVGSSASSPVLVSGSPSFRVLFWSISCLFSEALILFCLFCSYWHWLWPDRNVFLCSCHIFLLRSSFCSSTVPAPVLFSDLDLSILMSLPLFLSASQIWVRPWSCLSLMF